MKISRRKLILGGLVYLVGPEVAIGDENDPRSDYNSEWKKKYEEHEKYVRHFGQADETYIGDFAGIRSVYDGDVVDIHRFDMPIEIYKVVEIESLQAKDEFGLVFLQERLGETGFGDSAKKVKFAKLDSEDYASVSFEAFQAFHRGDVTSRRETKRIGEKLHATFRNGEQIVSSLDFKDRFLFSEEKEYDQRKVLRQANLIRYSKDGGLPIANASPMFASGRYESVSKLVNFTIRTINVESQSVSFTLKRSQND